MQTFWLVLFTVLFLACFPGIALWRGWQDRRREIREQGYSISQHDRFTGENSWGPQ